MMRGLGSLLVMIGFILSMPAFELSAFEAVALGIIVMGYVLGHVEENET